MFPPLVVLAGFVTGVSVALWAQLASEGARLPVGIVWLVAILTGLVAGAILPLARRAVLRLVQRIPASPEVRSRYARWEQGTYLILALTIFSALGLQLIVPVVLGIAAVFVLAQLALLRPSWTGRTPDTVVIGILFLLSGISALIYQVVWQRLLFSAIGTNSAAVTLVVSIFMLGLGFGALAGGRLSVRYSDRLPTVFATIELCIAVFGALSVPFIGAVGRMVVAAPLPIVALALMLLLLVPTLLMGATLPVLVAHINRAFADVGRSVGTLYFVNTLGSAIACFATVLVVFAFVGLRTTVYLAVAINVLVAAVVRVALVQRYRTS